MEVVEQPSELRARLAAPRRRGVPIGLVPTMGAVHAGHLSLVEAAARACDVVVASVFVNPLQFGPGEDYGSYPRDFEGDRTRLAAAGVDLLFAPRADAFTPAERRTTVHVAGLGDRLEGASRPGHFDGVATIVAKLLCVVGPDRAFFGEKDYQQLVVVQRMVADLDLPVAVVGCPTVREADGLALSSRNAYLDPAQRRQALVLSRALRALRASWDGDADSGRWRLHRMISAVAGVELDYAELCDPETLDPLEGVVPGPVRALVAARVGGTRLIDNIRLDPPAQPSVRGPAGKDA